MVGGALPGALGSTRQRQPLCNDCEKARPNQIVFNKIESIIRLMQDEQSGLPVKTAKSFMSKIPSVFTGTDLIQWMMRNLRLEDQQEAMHLANLIASHGYIFPIEDHTLSIKNDCTFYRFQTPCMWPSNNMDPENTDYAVYLCKRTMQGKARLELADYEAENLARLQKMFSRKWEFIFLQAESQAKVDKKRDKLERKVLDSQERAFWDVYRPVPGCVNTTELDIKKACRLSKSAKRCAECQKVAGAVSGARVGSISAPSFDQTPPTPAQVQLTPPSTSGAEEPTDSRTPEPSGAQLEKEVEPEEPQPEEPSDNHTELRVSESGKSKSDEAADESRPEKSATEERAAQPTGATRNQSHRNHHQHAHHHHHHHHHPHGHHHHHHHRQCPHHKHNQQRAGHSSSRELRAEPAKSSDKSDAESTVTEAATGGGDKCDSVGSREQSIRVPAFQEPGGRRKSECNRMLSVGDEERRPASACCTGDGGRANLSEQAHVLRKSSLNILRPFESVDGRALVAGLGGASSSCARKSSVNLGHSPLKVTQSVCAAGSSGALELAATGDERRSVGELERELEALRVRLERRIGGVKMSKVTQSYLSYFKQWAEYDPFIAQPIPSNPWVSDSTELWDSERQTKDVHCRRVRRWAFSLKELLSDPAGREQFHKFLEKEFSAENLKFWDAVQELKRVASRDVARRVEAIWSEYLAQDANCPINIDSKSYETSRRNMAKNRNNRCIFDEAAGHVYQLMKNDSYPRYLRSDMYKDYKEASERKRTNQVAFDVFKPQITTLKHKFNF